MTTRYPHEKDNIGASFIKSRVDALCKSFDKVLVVSLRPWVPPVVASLMHPSRKRDALANDYAYGNVEVRYIKNIVLPGRQKKKWGEKAYFSTLSLLDTQKFIPDIVHAHRTWPPGYVAMRLKKEKGWPYVVTGHGYDAYGLPSAGEFWKRTLKEIFSSADGITTVSRNNQKIMASELELEQSMIKLVPNGYDPAVFFPMDKSQCRKQLCLPMDKKILVSVGHLDPVKNHVSLVEACKILERDDVLFVIVGAGPEEKRLKGAITKNSVAKKFFLAGSKMHGEIPLWIGAADAFVLPSTMEGMPTVLFESLGCGRPFIGSSVGGIPEVVTPNLGRLVKTKDPLELASAITEVLSREWSPTDISRQVQKYQWQSLMAEVLKVYDVILDGRSSR
ncbi:MAG: glycosyltransferase [Candidatus Thermoplasmatota archaeon]|nr:glycosyltransferase [Candidatus Thermoplasmatota archaeon]